MGKKLTLQDVEVSYKMRPNDMSVEFEEDEQFEQYVSEQITKDNQWAWCMVEVRLVAQAIMDEWIWIGENIRFVAVESSDKSGYTYIGNQQ